MGLFYEMIKVIGIGNRLMKDDGIAIMVLENIRSQLESIGIEVIIGETDFEACFHQLNEDDFIIILDAVYKDLSVGQIHINDLQEAITIYGKPDVQHDASIFDLMKLYRKLLKGYLIGIEIDETGFGYGMSETMKKEFYSICLEVERIINKMIRCNLGERLSE
jgi:hydrogenase maturation protease